MTDLKRNERGSLLVEVIAVLALLGVMGAALFRQVQHRNEELDNINIASEARTVKEAALAYIQANRAELEATECTFGADEDYNDFSLDDHRDEIEAYMPDTWASDRDDDGKSEENGIIYEYSIYGTCYRLGSNAGDRHGLYATIMPNPDHLPSDFNLRRAGRVANLIGADGGIHAAGSNSLVGTMGSWETDYQCLSGTDCTSDWKKEDFFVVTTGMDIYIPEVEDSPDNAVIVPRTIAFEKLHSTDYFSVGAGNKNCVEYKDSAFEHEETSGTGVPLGKSDTIYNVGAKSSTSTDPCDPLFWVGTKGGSTDHSTEGQVYVKNNLYVGQDNTSTYDIKHAISLETGDTNTDRQITVHDITGENRLTLNADGEVIGRTNSVTGMGYKLDAVNGEIILFKEKNMTIDGHSGKVQVPTTRVKDGVFETDQEYKFFVKNGTSKEEKTEKYRVDPAYTSLMNDVRLSALGGVKLSDVLPNYIAKTMQTVKAESSSAQKVTKPDCPYGYGLALVVTPISWSQYVKSASLSLAADTTGTGTATAGHTHSIPAKTIAAAKLDKGTGQLTTETGDNTITLEQYKPVKITINAPSSVNYWTVALGYGDEAPTDKDPITALAQTYCVFDKTKLSAGGAVASGTAFHQEIGETGKSAPTSDRTATTCAHDYDCPNVEKCESSKCVAYGTCSESDGSTTTGGDHLYCIAGQKVQIECVDSEMCGTGKVCQNNRCKMTATD